jgi:hypothetical protein
VSIEVQSSPKGAQIFIDDSPDPLGIAPTALTLPRSSQIHRVRLHVDGYVDKETELAADRDARVVLDLVKAAEPPAQRPHRKGASHGPRAAPQASPAAEVRRPEPPTGEVKRDDLVDPFK